MAERAEHRELQGNAATTRAVSVPVLAALGCRGTENYRLSHEHITLVPAGICCLQDLPGGNDSAETLLLCLGCCFSRFLTKEKATELLEFGYMLTAIFI